MPIFPSSPFSRQGIEVGAASIVPGIPLCIIGGVFRECGLLNGKVRCDDLCRFKLPTEVHLGTVHEGGSQAGGVSSCNDGGGVLFWWVEEAETLRCVQRLSSGGMSNNLPVSP